MRARRSQHAHPNLNRAEQTSHLSSHPLFFLNSQLLALGSTCTARWGDKPISGGITRNITVLYPFAGDFKVNTIWGFLGVFFAVVTLNVALHKGQLVFSPTLRVNTNITLLCRCRHTGCYVVRAIDPEFSWQIRLRQENVTQAIIMDAESADYLKL